MSTMRVDPSKHSLFGASKLAADVMTQECGRHFGMKTHCLRGGCLTGPHHSGLELHGFLSYLVKTQLSGGMYACSATRASRCAIANLGGGCEYACSILEAFDRVEQLTGRAMRSVYVDQHGEGDHICYISDLSRFCVHYPSWDLTKSLDAIFEEIIDAWHARLRG